ncbi:MAG: HAD family phosphatase [Spirochaetales bacterium]|jgi:putative hydrolase of the HAD superfamily|nr:HAD family phosphatase [Spirochaetales bacterium]
MIHAVVFDFGQVISLPPAPGAMEKIADAAGVDAKTMNSLIWDNRSEYDRGLWSGREYYRRILAKAGQSRSEAVLEELARLDGEAWTNLNPATLKLMEDVQAAGLKLGILSNIPRDFLALARERFPVFTRCDAGIFSCEIGSIKPEPLIYEKLIAALGCAPREIVFFDDMPANVEKALELGIQAFVWENAENARKELRRLGAAV